MHTPDPTSATPRQVERPPELALAALLAVIGVLACVDIALDLRSSGANLHVLGEAAIAVLAVLAASALLRRLARRTRELGARLADTEAAAQRWRADAQAILQGLGACIDSQFDRWGLSAAEKETALLLLKGLSHKEVALARAISDATARQQAVAVYRKAGVAGRSELAAFFLEDLALPAAGRVPATAATAASTTAVGAKPATLPRRAS